MILKKTVDVLRSGGMDIQYRIRPDGGIVVTKIGNIRYSGRAGNTAVRQIAGTPLSAEAYEQRTKIAARGVYGRTVAKLPKIDKEIQNALKRAQYAFNKRGVKAGKPTTANIRYHQERGEVKKQIEEYLKETIRYAKGLSQIDYLYAILAEAKRLRGTSGIVEIEKGIYYLEQTLKQKDPQATTEQARDAADYLYECREYANRGAWQPAIAAAYSFNDVCKEMMDAGK